MCCLRRSYIFLVLSLICVQAGAQLHADFTSNAQEGCSPLVAQFTDISTGNPTQWSWDLGNGATSTLKNPGAIYVRPGTYTVTLRIRNAAGDIDSVTKVDYITVHENPRPGLIATPDEGCAPLTVQFTDTSNAGSGTIASWFWDFGDGNVSEEANPLHTYNNVDTFNVSLTIENSEGCRKTIQERNLIKIQSVLRDSIAYTYTDLCRVPANVAFRNASQSTTPIVTSIWDFGDGNSSTAQNPNHTYTTPGNFTVQLITINQSGCSDTTEQLLSVGTTKAAFSFTSACVNEAMVFTDESVPKPLTQKWYFGDGDSATGAVVEHTYKTSDTFEVTLIADFGNCTDTVKQVVQTAQKVHTDFTASGNLLSCDYPQTISFINQTQNATAYKWYFGDGSTPDTSANPIHIYTKPGRFSVKLVGYNGTGCADSITKTNFVQIGPPVIKEIQNLPTAGCSPQIVTMKPVISSGLRIVSYKWAFGDGASSSDSVPTHTYTTPGTYDVSLIVTAEGGCSDTLTIPEAVIVSERPKAAFTVYPVLVCAATPVQFTDSTEGRHSTWLWLFGDGSTSTEQNPQHYYQDTGFQNVTLIVSDNMCFDTMVVNNAVFVKSPIAKFSYSFICNQPFDYSFKDESIEAETWVWDFGDGDTSHQQNPQHNYTSKGKFAVTLTVTNGDCSHTITDSVNVIQESPTFTYEAMSTNFCKYDSIHFVVSDYDPGNIKTFQWDFGDGSRTTANLKYADTYHKYLKSGTYNPILFVIDANNCRDTVNRNLQMAIYGPKASFTNKPGDCINSTIDFVDQSITDGTHAITQWIWNYGDGSTDTLTSGPFSHIYNETGLYNVKLKLFDTNNCYDTLVDVQAVDITQPVAAFGVADSVKCSANLVQFIDSSSGRELEYAWDFGDGATSTDPDPSHSYASEGVYTIKLSLKDKFGCTDSLTKPNYLTVANPIAAFSIPDSVFACPPATVTATNRSTSYDSVTWHFGDGNSSTEVSPTHTYATANTYTLRLVVKGFGNCYDSAYKNILVKGPAAELFYSPFKGCDSLHVSFYTHSTNTVQYIWDFGDGNIQTGTDSVAEYTYLKPGSFLPKLIISDAEGCDVPIINDDTLLVSSVTAGFNAAIRPGVCDSTGVDFIDSSAVFFDKIRSYSWKFGDGDSSSQSQPLHFYTKPSLYNVNLDVTTENGCTDNYFLPLNISIDTTTQIFATVPDSVCANMPVNLNAGPVGNSTAVLSWLWDLGDGSSAYSEDTVYTYTTAGAKNLVTIARATNGCADTVKNTIHVVGQPPTDAGPDILICRGDDATLHASGAAVYAWAADATLSCTNCVSPTANPLSDNMYYVTGTNTFGCTATDSVLVKVVQPFTVSIAAGDTSCAGDVITLQASGASVYSWQPSSLVSDPSAATVTSAPTSTTTYTVIGKDSAGCFSDTASTLVHVSPYPTVQITDSAVTVIAGSEYQIVTQGSEDIVTWQWRPLDNLSCSNCPQPVVKPKGTIKYTVNVRNVAGCAAEDNITITVLCKDQNLFIPNTFSPNNDGMNDYFYPRGKGLAIIKSFRIFNRWGTLIFERHNFPPNQQSYGWDGMYNGSAQPSDVYVFVADISCDNGTIISSKGNVTLLR